jgi:hypothetical protein
MLHALKNRKKPQDFGFFQCITDRLFSAGVRGKPLKSGKTPHFWQLVWQLFKPS